MESTEPREQLLEAIVAEFTAALRAGEPPVLDTYLARAPQHAEELRELLTSVAMIEELKREALPPRGGDSPSDQWQQIQQLGDYRLVREIGRGGMGVVFEGIHQSLGRRVAIKIMHERLGHDPRYVARFRREAQAAARLHHTNIVGVFGVGEAAGRHYYVMEYIEGRPLNRVVRQMTQAWGRPGAPQASTRLPASTRFDNRVSGNAAVGPASEATAPSSTAVEAQTEESPAPPEPPRDRFRWVAEIGVQIADALDYAHGQGMLHRDIKPGNLLLDARGAVWITDFGLVKHFEGPETLTGDIVGTPQYMAPESFQSQYDQRSEVYCLGLTLYELATLRPAFSGGTTAELIQQITTGPPPTPRKIDPRIDRDLDTIIQRAIALRPVDRYPSAAALRDDLRAYVEDRPISARQPALWEQWNRWRRRNPLAATWASLSALLLVLLTTTATIGYLYTADANRRLADQAASLRQQQTATDAARRQAVENLHRADANLALSMKAFDEMFRTVLSGSSSLPNDIDIDGFAELGGMETSVTVEDAELLKRMLRFYEQFTQQNSHNESLKTELARAYRRVGNSYQLVGEFDAAIAAYRQAIPLYEVLGKAETTPVADLIQLIRIKSELSTAYRSKGEIRAAGLESRSCLRIIEDDPRGRDPAVQLEKARVLIALGANEYLLAATLLDRPRAENPAGGNSASANARRSPGQERAPLGAVLGSVYERRRLEDVKNAIAITEQLREQLPDNADYLFTSAKAYSILAALLLRNQTEEASQALSRAIELFEQLVKLFPDDLQYRYFMAIAYSMNLSDETELNNERIEQANSIANELVARSPNVLEYKKLKIKVNIQHGRRLIADEQLDEAWRDLEGARQELATLEPRSAGAAFWRVHRLLADSYRRLGERYQTRRETRKANDAFRAARQVNERMRRPETGQ